MMICFQPKTENEYRPLIRWRIMAVIAVLVVSIASSYVMLSFDHKFDSKEWKKLGTLGSWDDTRTHMVDDLLRRYELVGMTKAEIDTLLGVPRETSYFREYDYVYWLGPERGFMSIDSEWLGIRFENDVAVEARLLRD